MTEADPSIFPCARLGVIGGGRTAHAFGIALAPHSRERPLVYARSTKQAAALAKILGGQSASNAQDLLLDCDLTVMAVSDDAIAPMAERMAEGVQLQHAPFLFHLGGRSGASILKPLHQAGALTAAIHPAMTFTGDAAQEIARMKGAPFAVTGHCQASDSAALAVVRQLGGVPVIIAEDKRALYHAALCHASNHLVTLLASAAEMLAVAGVTDPQAFMTPLVRAAVENSLERGFAALSGPVLRGDVETITRHLAVMAQDAPAILPEYRAMARATLEEIDRRAIGDPERRAAMAVLLD